MKKNVFVLYFLLCFSFVCNLSYAKTEEYADVVYEYTDSGIGPMKGPYGGTYPDGPGFPISVSPNVVLGSEPGATGFNDFLSLPEGSSVTVGFINKSIKDGPGNDFFIQEIGGNGEKANVYISSDGVFFTLLGVAQDDTTTEFDLASIKYTDRVNAIKIVGLDNNGNSPGFDVVNIQIFSDSVDEATDTQRISILNAGMQLHIPELIYLNADGEQKNIWADLQLVPNRNSDEKILFEVTEYGFIETDDPKRVSRRKSSGTP